MLTQCQTQCRQLYSMRADLRRAYYLPGTFLEDAGVSLPYWKSTPKKDRGQRPHILGGNAKLAEGLVSSCKESMEKGPWVRTGLSRRPCKLCPEAEGAGCAQARVGWGEGVLAWGARKSTSLKGQVQTLGARRTPGSCRSEVGVRGGCQVEVGPNQN